MAKYLLLIIEDESPYADGGDADFGSIMEAHQSFMREIEELGATYVSGEALLPIATATYLRGTRTDAVATVDNPAPDLKEVLGGFYLIEAPDDEVARAVAARCPAPAGYVEMRPIWDVAAAAAEYAGDSGG